ncbi:hypothetical protein DY000_02024772, partial [Brassica cretica]
MYFLFLAFLFNSSTANKVADSLIQKSCKKITKFLDKNSDSNFLKDLRCISQRESRKTGLASPYPRAGTEKLCLTSQFL